MVGDREDRNLVQAVLRAFDLLTYFSHSRPAIGLADLARESGLNKATVYRLMATMERAGIISRTPDNLYRPSLRLFQIGSVVLDTLDLPGEARPVMRDFVVQHKTSIYLAVLHEGKALCIEKATGPEPMQIIVFNVGTSLPLNVGAAPRALLAYQGTEDREAFLRSVERARDGGAPAARRLRNELAEIRERGYSLAHDDLTEGVSAIGVPVFDHRQEVVGALSVGLLSQRANQAEVSKLVAGLRAAAAELSNRLGAAANGWPQRARSGPPEPPG
jgi:DNA-binding IclR family transcriptional regulator